MTVYIITRYSMKFLFQTYNRNKSCVLAFSNREKAQESHRKLLNLIWKLQSLEMSAEEYREFMGIDTSSFNAVQCSDWCNKNEEIIENILFYDDQFEPIREFVKFYEDSETTHKLDDHFYIDINIGFHVEEVEMS